MNLLLTSPKGYSERLIKAFEELKENRFFHPVAVPMIQTEIYIESADFIYFMHHLDQYDYIAFSSRKSIEAFALALQKEQVSLPDQTQLCAIGKDNECILDNLNKQPAFISTEPSPMGIVKHLQHLPETRGKKIAVLAPEVVGMKEPHIVPDFIEGLQHIGMEVERITAYRTKAVSKEILSETYQKIVDQDYAAVIFTSGTEIKVFLQMVPEGVSIEEFTRHLTIICYGPYTASCAEAYGMKVSFTSKRFGSFQELVEQIHSYYRGIQYPEITH